jgi:hypothetical protein
MLRFDVSWPETLAMASCGFPALLALEIPEPGRSAADRCWSTGADPTHEH